MKNIKSYNLFNENTYHKDSYYYHWTSSYYLRAILEDNKLKINRTYKELNIKGICLTRDITYDYRKIRDWYDVRLMLDKNKLNNNYKVIPYDYHSTSGRKFEYDKRNINTTTPYEFEEDVITEEIKDLHKYLKEVHYFNNISDNGLELKFMIEKYNIRNKKNVTIERYDDEKIYKRYS